MAKTKEYVTHPMRQKSIETNDYVKKMLRGSIEENGGEAGLKFLRAKLALDRGMSYKSINELITIFCDLGIFSVYKDNAGEEVISLFNPEIEAAEKKIRESIDIDLLTTGLTASFRNKVIQLKEVLLELENTVGKSIPITQLAKGAEEKGLTKEEFEVAVQKLKRQGDLFEPKKGFISRI